MKPHLYKNRNVKTMSNYLKNRTPGNTYCLLLGETNACYSKVTTRHNLKDKILKFEFSIDNATVYKSFLMLPVFKRR